MLIGVHMTNTTASLPSDSEVIKKVNSTMKVDVMCGTTMSVGITLRGSRQWDRLSFFLSFYLSRTFSIIG